MNIPIQVTVDLIQEYQLFTFTAKQKDIGRSAVITVTANGQVIPVTEADGANIYIAKPDGTKVYNACRFDNGRVVAELTNQMLASAGTAKVELELGAASGSRITTPIFNLKVLPTQIDGTAIESSNEFTALQQALLQVGEIATMRADIGDLTKLKTTAKSSLVDAVNEQNSKFAPAGFGLGEQVYSSNRLYGMTSLDNLKKTCDFSIVIDGGATIYGVNFSQAYGQHTAYNNGGHHQELFMLGINCVFIRDCWNGVWSPWECKNPPMELGVEYRTTERWNGRAVYTMCVSCGALPNSSTTFVEHILPYNITVISATGFGKSNTETVMIPNTEISVNANSEWGYIVITTTSDKSNYTESYVTVKYIKN